jgi:nitrate reductase NapAB chaperone NapD
VGGKRSRAIAEFGIAERPDRLGYNGAAVVLHAQPNMTELLQQAISELQQLPIEQQDAMVEDRPEVIASRILAEIQDEKPWD